MFPAGASPFLIAVFIVLAIVVVAVAIVGVAAAGRSHDRGATFQWTVGFMVVAAIWMVGTWQVAASSVLLQFDRKPPPFVLLVSAVFVVSAAIVFSPLGSRLVSGLSLAALVGFQAFRLPLELTMHRAFTEGVMPEQMSYSGRNFDILTGISAAIVAILLWRGVIGARLAAAWNAIGALLLGNILVVAIASTPMFAAFGPDRLNTWVAYPPFVWLPTVFVVFAIAGHMLVWRKLRTKDAGRGGSASAEASAGQVANRPYICLESEPQIQLRRARRGLVIRFRQIQEV